MVHDQRQHDRCDDGPASAGNSPDHDHNWYVAEQQCPAEQKVSHSHNIARQEALYG
jgi:hypothetical protein